MEKVIVSVDELNAIINGAIQTALDAREKKAGDATLISRDAAARRLGVDVSTLWRWQRCGYIKKAVRIGRFVYFTEGELRRLERGEREA